MKGHRYKIEIKPFQKRVEDMVKDLEALFKQEESLTTKEILFCGVMCIVIGLIVFYAWFSFLDWYSETQLNSTSTLLLCCCAVGQCYQRFQQKSYRAAFGMVLSELSKGFVNILWTLIKFYPCYVCGNDCAPYLYKSGTITFFLTFFLLIPIVA